MSLCMRLEISLNSCLIQAVLSFNKGELLGSIPSWIGPWAILSGWISFLPLRFRL